MEGPVPPSDSLSTVACKQTWTRLGPRYRTGPWIMRPLDCIAKFTFSAERGSVRKHHSGDVRDIRAISSLEKEESHTTTEPLGDWKNQLLFFLKSFNFLFSLSVEVRKFWALLSIIHSFIHSMIFFFFFTEYLLGTVRHQCQANVEIVSVLRELAI